MLCSCAGWSPLNAGSWYVAESELRLRDSQCPSFTQCALAKEESEQWTTPSNHCAPRPRSAHEHSNAHDFDVVVRHNVPLTVLYSHHMENISWRLDYIKCLHRHLPSKSVVKLCQCLCGSCAETTLGRLCLAGAYAPTSARSIGPSWTVLDRSRRIQSRVRERTIHGAHRLYPSHDVQPRAF